MGGSGGGGGRPPPSPPGGAELLSNTLAQWLVCWGCAGCCGGRLTVFAVHTPPSSGRPRPASLCFRVREPQVPRSARAPVVAHWARIPWAPTNNGAVPQEPPPPRLLWDARVQC